MAAVKAMPFYIKRIAFLFEHLFDQAKFAVSFSKAPVRKTALTPPCTSNPVSGTQVD
jgi:hypothetical protein